jgi:hypothetical protein
MHVHPYRIGSAVWLEANGEWHPGQVSDYQDTAIGRLYEITLDSGERFVSRCPEPRKIATNHEH